VGRAESKPGRGRDLYCPPLAPATAAAALGLPPLRLSLPREASCLPVSAGCAAWLPLALAPARSARCGTPAPLATAGPRTRHVMSGPWHSACSGWDSERNLVGRGAHGSAAHPRGRREVFALACMDDQFKTSRAEYYLPRQ
jgi:hypothetical protein